MLRLAGVGLDELGGVVAIEQDAGMVSWVEVEREVRRIVAGADLGEFRVRDLREGIEAEIGAIGDGLFREALALAKRLLEYAYTYVCMYKHIYIYIYRQVGRQVCR